MPKSVDGKIDMPSVDPRNSALASNPYKNIEKTKEENDSKLYRETLLEHMKNEGHMKLPEDKSEWDQSQYLFPTYENDILLSYLPDEGTMFKNDRIF